MAFTVPAKSKFVVFFRKRCIKGAFQGNVFFPRSSAHAEVIIAHLRKRKPHQNSLWELDQTHDFQIGCHFLFPFVCNSPIFSSTWTTGKVLVACSVTATTEQWKEPWLFREFRGMKPTQWNSELVHKPWNRGWSGFWREIVKLMQST